MIHELPRTSHLPAIQFEKGVFILPSSRLLRRSMIVNVRTYSVLERYSLAGALRNAFGHGEVLDMGYNSPIAGRDGRTMKAKLSLPRVRRTDASFNLEGIMDRVRR